MSDLEAFASRALGWRAHCTGFYSRDWYDAGSLQTNSENRNRGNRGDGLSGMWVTRVDCIRGLSVDRNGVAKDTTPATRPYCRKTQFPFVLVILQSQLTDSMNGTWVIKRYKHVPQLSSHKDALPDLRF